MEADRREALEALHRSIRATLSHVEPKQLVWRRRPNGPTVGELIGLLLMDLDLLSSHSQNQGLLPEFATEFMNKRLARRLAERYVGRDLAAEFDRRFAVAQNVVAQDRTDLEPALDRMGSRLEELVAAISSNRAGR